MLKKFYSCLIVKRLVLVILCILLCFSFSACSQPTSDNDSLQTIGNHAESDTQTVDVDEMQINHIKKFGDNILVSDETKTYLIDSDFNIIASIEMTNVINSSTIISDDLFVCSCDGKCYYFNSKLEDVTSEFAGKGDIIAGIKRNDYLYDGYAYQINYEKTDSTEFNFVFFDGVSTNLVELEMINSYDGTTFNFTVKSLDDAFSQFSKSMTFSGVDPLVWHLYDGSGAPFFKYLGESLLAFHVKCEDGVVNYIFDYKNNTELRIDGGYDVIKTLDGYLLPGLYMSTFYDNNGNELYELENQTETRKIEYQGDYTRCFFHENYSNGTMEIYDKNQNMIFDSSEWEDSQGVDITLGDMFGDSFAVEIENSNGTFVTFVDLNGNILFEPIEGTLLSMSLNDVSACIVKTADNKIVLLNQNGDTCEIKSANASSFVLNNYYISLDLENDKILKIDISEFLEKSK